MGKQRRASKSTALSLLPVLDNGPDVEIDDNAVPLKMYDPNLSAENCLRRSPRSTTNVYRSSNHTALSPCLTEESSVKRCRQEKKRCGGSIDGEGTSSKKVKASSRNSDGKALNNKCLRRSPRLIGGGVEGKCELLSLPEPPSVMRRQSSSEKFTISKKCLRSRVIPFAVVEAAKSPLLVQNQDKDKKTSTVRNKQPDSGLIEGSNSTKKSLRSGVVPFAVAAVYENAEAESAFPNLADKCQENNSKEVKMNESLLGNGDSPMLSDAKCLRSRKIEFRCAVIEAEQIETDCSSIEWPLNSEEKQPQENKSNNKASVSLEKKKNNKASASSEKESNNKASVSSEKKERKQKKIDVSSFFIGEPVPDDEARERWRWRYELKSQRRKGQSWILNADEEDEVILNVECHYSQAQVGGCIINLGDCAYIKGEGRQKDIGRIIEFFKTMDGEDYFRVQWFYRAEDTVMKEAAAIHDKKRIFYSTLMNDNLLDCIVSKVNVIEIAPVLALQPSLIPPCDFYCDMEYCVEYSTFRTLLAGSPLERSELSLPSYPDTYCSINTTPLEDFFSCAPYKADLALLDLYSGCGGMSTGLCLGAKLSGINLVTRWAIDYHKSACDSLKLNHPETQARHTTAEDFLELLKEWEKLCQRYLFDDYERTLEYRSKDRGEPESKVDAPFDVKMPRGEYEVSCLVDICYGDPNESGEDGLKFKVRWKGYDQSEDTWEPIEGLSNCQEQIRDFVISGRKSKILPLPGEVDVICGGPPCQGISGYNRYRSIGSPLNDERNRQIIVFMDIVKFLKPKYALMENVVDILKFDKASLGRYALSRLVDMKYQARLGTMAAGCYGLPQFRLRVFLWGALPTEKLPQFPLPTHDVVVRYWPPNEFEQNTVAYNEGQPRDLEEAVVLRDAISDLPAVTSHETREEMMYEMPPESEFQKYIRLTKYEMMGFVSNGYQEVKRPVLYDHRPYQLSEDDYLRVCQIPRKKGANFRDLPGVIVSADNVVIRDPEEEPLLPSGKRLVPDYVFTFEKGKSKRPFARLWWDETVATVVTFPSLHNQAALHPEQDRVLTLREYARLQGFPDFYRFCGTVKERYCQVGNAVAVPVARALGYALGMAVRKLTGPEPLMTLPPKFAFQRAPIDEIFI